MLKCKEMEELSNTFAGTGHVHNKPIRTQVLNESVNEWLSEWQIGFPKEYYIDRAQQNESWARRIQPSSL